MAGESQMDQGAPTPVTQSIWRLLCALFHAEQQLLQMLPAESRNAKDLERRGSAV
jgi:hypothetical protein